MTEATDAGGESRPSYTSVLEPASERSLGYFQSWVGNEAVQFLQGMEHEIYCTTKEQSQEELPKHYYVRDRERILEFEILTRKPRNPYWPFEKNTVLTASFVFEDDFVSEELGSSLTFYHDANRREFKTDTLSFLRFASETLKRIKTDTIIVLHVVNEQDQRYDLYKKMLEIERNPPNIKLISGEF